MPKLAAMATAWERLADEIGAAMSERGWTQGRLADAAGVAERTVRDLLSGRDRARWPNQTLRKIEHALGWETGRARRILEGAPPQEQPERLLPSAEVGRFQVRELRRAILRADLTLEQREDYLDRLERHLRALGETEEFIREIRSLPGVNDPKTERQEGAADR